MHRTFHAVFLRRLFAAVVFASCLSCLLPNVAAHPLGNFTINHFTRIEVGADRLRVRYIVDMAEIPTIEEIRIAGLSAEPGERERLAAYAGRVASGYAEGLVVSVDGVRVPLTVVSSDAGLVAGQGGLSTLRVVCELSGVVSATSGGEPRRLVYRNTNYGERLGWRELVVVPASGTAIFDSTAFGSAVTDELKAYPEDRLAAPLDERSAEISFRVGAAPEGTAALRTREGGKVESTRDPLADLISVGEMTPLALLTSLLIAFGFGALHALSPGHGKTVVGAYLVGTRGTPKHAAFLGATVTITHTAGVFALGIVTLFASQYFLPERLFPLLGAISGAIVVAVGVSLFRQRLAALTGADPHHHHHDHSHEHENEHEHEHDGLVHSHGGVEHSHLPPGADGSKVTWSSLLALGVSGGLLPCPSALVLMLGAIALNRVGLGLLLVVAFSLGLASVLTGIGLAFVYGGRLLKGSVRNSRAFRYLPVVSAGVIACLGLVICYQALAQAGFDLSWMRAALAAEETSFKEVSTLGVLFLGLVFGLKHATEADHVVAVSTIVSEHRKLLRAAFVGALWGIGHTVSIVVVGTIVLLLRVSIPEHVGSWLEFGVALMIVGLGVVAFVRALKGRSDVHLHTHAHDGHQHAHVHFHEGETSHEHSREPHTHEVSRIGFKPIIVGAIHGLAGSAALTVLVLAEIESTIVGLMYLFVFGIGSIAGMLLMSGLIGLPFAFTAKRLGGFHVALQMIAGVFSILFGLWYAYDTGVASQLYAAVF